MKFHFCFYQLRPSFNCRHRADRRVDGLKGWRDGWVVGVRYGWPVCEVWADRWVEGEGKG